MAQKTPENDEHKTTAPLLPDEVVKAATDKPVPDKADTDATEDPLEDDKTNQAIDDITRSESDAQLETAFASPSSDQRHGWRQRYLDHKKWTIPLTLVLVALVVVGALPSLRYKALGLVLKQQYSVTLSDNETHAPVSSAVVTLGKVTAKTDGEGKVTLSKVPLGKQSLTITKQYYKTYTTSVLVGLKKPSAQTLQLTATGRQVPITVVNNVTGQGIANATLAALGTEAKTDKNGKVTMVLPADKPSASASISASGYNSVKATVQITTQVVADNTLSLVPVGHVYFLSNRSGKIDIVSTNYDGSNRQTVLPGSGYEDSSAQISPSPDQKYIALRAVRHPLTNAQGLYIVNSTTGKTYMAEEGSNIGITWVGWSGNYFVYAVYDYATPSSQPGYMVIRSINATNGTKVTLDTSDSIFQTNSYYASLVFTPGVLVDGTLVYGRYWSSSYYASSLLQGKTNTIYSVTPNGSNKKKLDDIAIPTNTNYTYMNETQVGPHAAYVQNNTNAEPPGNVTYYSYNKGSVSQLSNLTQAQFNQPNDDGTTFVASSPSSDATLYQQSVDGNLVLSVGDSDGNNKHQVASLPTKSTVIGWLTDDYLLVTQNTNQLYVVSAHVISTAKPLLVSDFLTNSYSY